LIFDLARVNGVIRRSVRHSALNAARDEILAGPALPTVGIVLEHLNITSILLIDILAAYAGPVVEILILANIVYEFVSARTPASIKVVTHQVGHFTVTLQAITLIRSIALQTVDSRFSIRAVGAFLCVLINVLTHRALASTVLGKSHA
jgi:hypothetical protein